MEVVDPFTPTFQPDRDFHLDIPEQWGSPFSTPEEPMPEVVSQAAAVVTAAPFGADVADVAGNSVERSKELAARVANTLQELQGALEESESDRHNFLAERVRMQARIDTLEREARLKEEFKSLLLEGAGGEISYDDLKSLQGMTDSLVQDPDRLTVLFNVVQQAAKLASVVTVYNRLRQHAEES